MRITAQLIDAATGTPLWAERYDGALEDIFDVQDEITAQRCWRPRAELRRAEIERAQSKDAGEPRPYERICARCRAPERILQPKPSRRLNILRPRSQIDPGYGEAQALAAYCHHVKYTRGGRDPTHRDAAIRYARAALATGTNDSMALATAAFVLAIEGREFDTALGALERALEVNPNSALALGRAAQVNIFVGNYSKAIDQAHRSIRLSPFDPLRYIPEVALAFAYFLTEQFPEAAEAAMRAIQSSPSFNVPHLLLAASYIHLGRAADARAEVQRALDLQPGFTIAAFTAVGLTPGQGEPIAAALRKAGLPDEPVLSLPDKPSIAVLAFQNMSGDVEQEYFADGVAEDIITALSRNHAAVRHRAQLELHLQGPRRRREAGRPRTWGALCARRQRAQGRQPRAHHRPAHRSRQPATTCGPNVTTASCRIFSRCRTRSPRASPWRSGPRWRRPSASGWRASRPRSLDAWEAYHRGLWHYLKQRRTRTRWPSRSFNGPSISIRTLRPATTGWLWRTAADSNPYGLLAAADASPLARDLARKAVALDDADAVALYGLRTALLLGGDLEGGSRRVRARRQPRSQSRLGHGRPRRHVRVAQPPARRTGLDRARHARQSTRSDDMGVAELDGMDDTIFARDYGAALATADRLIRARPEHGYIYRVRAASSWTAGPHR